MMSKLQNLFTGIAGELAVRSEFILKGWNVASPEVDKGNLSIKVVNQCFSPPQSSGEKKRVQDFVLTH